MHPITYASAQFAFSRVPDGFPLGVVSMPLPQDVRAYRGHTGGDQMKFRRFESLDAGLDWVRSTPNLPDIQAYPVTHRVYGPRLASWHGATMVGHVWAQAPIFLPGLDSAADMRKPSFLVVQDGKICAKMVHDGRTWKITLPHRDGARMVRRQCVRLDRALETFVSELAINVLGQSRHGAMEMLASVDSILPLAEDFLARRAAWRRVITERTPDVQGSPHACHMKTVVLYRSTDHFALGTIAFGPEGFCSVRNGVDNNTLVPRERIHTPSLQAAIDWLGTSPHAPDLKQFSKVTSRNYGKALWTLPGAVVYGVIDVPENSSKETGYRLLVIADGKGVRARVAHGMDEAWSVSSVLLGGATHTEASSDRDSVLVGLVDSIVSWYTGPEQTRLQAEAPRALHAIRAFLDDRAAQVRSFERGTHA